MQEIFEKFNSGRKEVNIVKLLNNFIHNGPNGRHVCMVFEVMGPNILDLIKQYHYRGIPARLVRKVATHALMGMDYLHRVCNIIHTDFKPENMLVCCPRGHPVNKHGESLIPDVPIVTPPKPEVNLN